MREPKNFIFDFDGVLADTESIWFECLLDFARKWAPSVRIEDMERCVGDGDTKMMELLSAGLGSRSRLDELYPELRTDFRARSKELGLRPGVGDYLDYADSRNIGLACASSSHRVYIDDWLSRLGIADRFRVIVTRDDIAQSKNVKPCPDIYLEALNRLGAKPEECVAFEDSLIGIRAAEAAGLLCVSVPNRVSEKKTAALPNYRLNMAVQSPKALLRELFSENM